MTSSATDDFFADLPRPEPLPTAIEGCLIGTEVGGPIVPDAEDVASITEEHAWVMAVLLTDIADFERCRALGIAPESGRQPRTDEQRERLTARVTNDLANTRRKYESCIDLYEQAFGAEATQHLDHFVRNSPQAAGQADTPKQQSNLFD